MSQPSARIASTSDRVLDAAERLMQTRGFNGFSYADISAELGLSKATLHHHFATKAELGRALVERYSQTFHGALQAIDASSAAPRHKLERYVDLYRGVLSDERLCLCAMLAAEYNTLPRAMQEPIRHFFDTNESWLGGVIEAGRRSGELRFHGSAADTGRMLLGALEGAMLVARTYGDVERFTSAARAVLTALEYH
jgi:TetR/AcrR family transcriptional repressor of nem operon